MNRDPRQIDKKCMRTHLRCRKEEDARQDSAEYQDRQVRYPVDRLIHRHRWRPIAPSAPAVDRAARHLPKSLNRSLPTKAKFSVPESLMSAMVRAEVA